MKIQKRNRRLEFDGEFVFFCKGGFQDRIECILNLLYSGSCPSLEDIVESQQKTFGKAEDFTVNNARQDLKYMRTALRVPVDYSRSKRGYYLTDPLWHRGLEDMAHEEMNIMKSLVLPMPALGLDNESAMRKVAEKHFREIVECLITGMLEHHDLPFQDFEMRQFACSLAVTAWNLCLEKSSLNSVNKAIQKIMKSHVLADRVHNYMSYAAEMKWQDYREDRFRIISAEPVLRGKKTVIAVTVGDLA